MKGLPEKKKESWADTRNALAKHVAKAYNMDFPKAYQMFERVHRGGGDGFGEKKKGKRDIFALCIHWDDSEKLVLGSNKAHKAMPKKDRISFDYKYGPLTNARRDIALKTRKDLLHSKEFDNAFVKFPAKLMVKKKNDEEYSEYDDFSKRHVSKLAIFDSVDE